MEPIPLEWRLSQAQRPRSSQRTRLGLTRKRDSVVVLLEFRSLVTAEMTLARGADGKIRAPRVDSVVKTL